MAVATFSNKRSGFYLGQSASLNIINEEIVISSGAGVLDPGTVLGRIYTDAPGATAGTPFSAGGGTVGNGAVSAVSADAGAMEGLWQVEIVGAAGATAAFKVVRPDGSVDGQGNVGTPYNGTGSINFSIADGSTDWGPNMFVPITVSYDATPGKEYVLHDPALTNGGQYAAAILFHRVDATSADVKTVATVRGPATINGNCLTFKSGISAADQAKATEALRAKGMAVLPQHAA